MLEWLEIGLAGLFIGSFLAATILPFSSEAILAACLMTGFDPLACLITASLGNTLGGMTSYYLGYLGDWNKIGRWLRIKEGQIERWDKLIKRHGAYVGLMCWLPFVGDMIALALGVFRVSAPRTLFWMLLGKTARYAVLTFLLTR